MQGYRVTVNLAALAAHLVERYDRSFSIWTAAHWLAQDYFIGDRVEPSPFMSAGDGVFYSVEDPAAWLDEDEIIDVTPSDLPPSHRWRCN